MAFVAWAGENFIEEPKDRERPSVKEIRRDCSKSDTREIIQRDTEKDIETICAEKGELRQIVMDLLYWAGGLKGPEIGRISGFDYCSVSQERKRLREKRWKDRTLQSLMSRIEGRLSTSGNRPPSLLRAKYVVYYLLAGLFWEHKRHRDL